MKKTLLALGLAAMVLFTACDGPTKIVSSITTKATAVKVVVGEDQTMMLDSDGNLWVAGQNDVGEFGNSNAVAVGAKQSKLTKVAENVVDFDFSYYAPGHGNDGISSTYIVKKDGFLYVSGSNSHGQLGNTDTSTVITDFTKVSIKDSNNNDVIVKKVAAGNLYSMIIDENGDVYGAGDNTFGSIGLGTTTSFKEYTKVDIGSKKAAKIVANTQVTSWNSGDNGLWGQNSGNSAIITTDGLLYVAGADWWGSIGNGDSNAKTFKDSGLANVTNVAMGPMNTYAIADGKVYGAGDNFAGQLPGILGGSTAFVELTGYNGTATLLSAGFRSVVVKTSEGTYAAGSQDFGVFGNGVTSGALSTFTQIANNISVSKISICGTSGAVIDSTGNLWMTGDNYYGNFGNGTKSDVNATDYVAPTNTYLKVTSN